MKSRVLKGLQLEVGAQMARRLITSDIPMYATAASELLLNCLMSSQSLSILGFINAAAVSV